MTPAETLVRISALTKRDLRMAWTAALLQRTTKFPKKPEEMWEQKKTEGSDLLTMAKALKASQEGQDRLRDIRARYRARMKRRAQKKRDKKKRASAAVADAGAVLREE